MTSGGSLNLALGQLGLFDLSKQTENGITAINSFQGLPKNNEFMLKVGQDNKVLSRTGNTKSNSTYPFKISEVVNVRVSAPKTTEQKVDEVVLGYNGIDATSAITFKKGDRKAIYLELSGNWIGLLGFPDNKVAVEYVIHADECNPLDTCVDCDGCDSVESAPLVLKAIEFFKEYQLRGGLKVSDAVEITPVKECATEPFRILTPYVFQTLTVVDSGDPTALAMIQAQFPSYKVVLKDRTGSTSTYEVITPDGTTLADYSQSIASILKGCEDCPAGYTASTGGVMYSVTIVDGGADLSTTVDDLPGFVSGTVIKNGQSGSVGTYSVVVDNELTSAEIATFLAASTAKGTATITKVGEIATVCANGTTTDIAWVEGETCNVSNEIYKITLPDTECGASRLTELQEAFPYNTVALDGNTTRTVTLTGTSGTANVTVGGVDYLSTFATSLTQTATNFVTTHAAAIKAATGITVTSAAAVLTFTGINLGFPTIAAANVTTDLAGTVAAATSTTVEGGCQTSYTISVPTNLVCDECSDIYNDYFTSNAPATYEAISWTKVEGTPAYGTCKMGIRFKGKEFFVAPGEELRDMLSYEESSTKIEVSGGYITEVREGIGSIIDNPMKVTYLSKWQPRTHMGGNLTQYEDEGRYFFQGEDRHKNYLERVIASDTSLIDTRKQYVDVTIEIERNQFAGGNSQKYNNTNAYVFHAEFGRHDDLLALANKIAGAAGLSAVSI